MNGNARWDAGEWSQRDHFHLSPHWSQRDHCYLWEKNRKQQAARAGSFLFSAFAFLFLEMLPPLVVCRVFSKTIISPSRVGSIHVRNRGNQARGSPLVAAGFHDRFRAYFRRNCRRERSIGGRREKREIVGMTNDE